MTDDHEEMTEAELEEEYYEIMRALYDDRPEPERDDRDSPWSDVYGADDYGFDGDF